MPAKIKTAFVAFALVAMTSFNLQAGALEPTNAPAPTMFSLEEIYLKLLSLEQKLDAISECLNCDGHANLPAGMSLIPAGDFMMGDTFSEGAFEERPPHTVSVSAFYMDRYEVTKALWDDVLAWAATNGYFFNVAGTGKATNHPVHSIDWYDAIAWCNARSEREGLSPCYTNASGAVYRDAPGNSFDGGCNWSANGYRLPTEAEWEKAARGGVAGQRFPWGGTISHSNANYYASPTDYSYDVNPAEDYHPAFSSGIFPYTSPVGSFAPNGFGLYDMAGNIMEWCWDWYGGSYYNNSPSTDPRGPAIGDSGAKVLRGGAWSSDAYSLRVAWRYFLNLDSADSQYGFRCVRGL